MLKDIQHNPHILIVWHWRPTDDCNKCNPNFLNSKIGNIHHVSTERVYVANNALTYNDEKHCPNKMSHIHRAYIERPLRPSRVYTIRMTRGTHRRIPLQIVSLENICKFFYGEETTSIYLVNVTCLVQYNQ